MHNIRVAAAALNQIPMDFEGNYERICMAIDAAHNKNVAILCLPELCITGYSLEDMFFSQEINKKALIYLYKITNYIGNTGMVVSVGLPLNLDGALYNVTAVIQNCEVLGFVPKQNLANDGVHYETRWFKPGIPNYSATISNFVDGFGTFDSEFGDLIFQFDEVAIGFEICEDLWVANRPGALLAQKGVDIILNPSASHFAFGKHKIRENMVIESSRAYKCTYVYSNLLGNEAGRIIFEGDNIIASGGKLLATSQRLSFEDIILTTAVVDLDHTSTQKVMNGSFHPYNKNYEIVHGDELLTTDKYLSEDNKFLAEELKKHDEFIYAETLGLFDYMRKSHSNGYVISLSGGVDSAITACLIKFMINRGIEQLGKTIFIDKSGLKIKKNILNDISEILTCVYQGTQNSSNKTLKAAKNLAEEIGANFIHLELNDILNSYTNKIEKAIKRKLSWEKDDITLQNIQARIRIPSVWMLANIKNALLICTSNRSEAAVGYCTADGDLSGSLAPIAGVDKKFLLEWINEVYARSINNMGKFYGSNSWQKSVFNVINNIPTAELRPASSEQLDEKDLMPYSILEFIEKEAILNKKMPNEVLQTLIMEFGTVEYSINQYKTYINKFFSLWQKNQWKRSKMPISFILDNECLDPKTWMRFPDLSKEFEKV